MVLSIKEYLDRELIEVDSELPPSEIIRARRDDATADRFIDLFEAVYSEWGSQYGTADSIEQVEGRCYNFLFNDPELETICLSAHRDHEEATLGYVSPLVKGKGRILDVGIGGGIKSVYYALTSGGLVTGMDRLKSALALAVKRAEKYGVDLDLVNANAREFDLNREFDAVLATCVLHESGDGRDGGWYGPRTWVGEKVQNLAKHLAPEGLFLATFQEIHGMPGMCRQIAAHADDEGLVDIKVEDILENDSHVLRAISAVKPGVTV